MNRGIRHNEGKPQWSLIPMKALEPGVRVLMEGAKKYGTNNWRKGLLTREICESMLRHIYSYLDGEDNDSESGQPHVGHIIANAIFLSDMHLTRPDMDNRFLKEKQCCGKWDEYGKCTCADNREKPGGDINHDAVVSSSLSDIAETLEAEKRNDSQNAKKGKFYPKGSSFHMPLYWNLDLYKSVNAEEGFILYGEDEDGNPYDHIGRSGRWVRYYGRGGKVDA